MRLKLFVIEAHGLRNQSNAKEKGRPMINEDTRQDEKATANECESADRA